MAHAFSRLGRLALLGGLSLTVVLVGLAIGMNEPGWQGLWTCLRLHVPGLAPAVLAGEKADDGTPRLSQAEQIAHLRRSLESDRRYLATLKGQLADPRNPLHQAEAAFERVDQDLHQKEDGAAQGQDPAGDDQTSTDARQKAVADLKVRWRRARDRFELALKEHKELQQTLTALARKIDQDQHALEQLSGAAAEEPAAEAAVGAAVPPAGEQPATSAAVPAEPAGGKPKANPPEIPLPAISTTPKPSSPASKPQTAPTSKSGKEEPPSPEVVKARAEAQRKEAAAHKAESRAQSLTERLAELDTNIKLAQRLLATARKRADEEQNVRKALDADLHKLLAAGASPADTQPVVEHCQRSQQRVEQARAEVAATTDRLHELQRERGDLQDEQIRALKEADSRKRDAVAAEDRVARLENPFQPHNLMQWLLFHGPRMALVLVGTYLAQRTVRLFGQRIVHILTRGGMSKRGTHQERENRAQTLVDVFRNTGSLLILAGGSLMLLQEMGIPIIPLLGGAAVLGLAVAFGAQNLIRDYFSGFMVLLEDQYGINDVVRIGNISGLVEHVSLRMTVLRDMEGVVHFIPHGTITTVSNLTHGWSRAVFDVPVAYKEDVDRVMQVLLDLGREMQQDPTFGPLLLDEPQMLGVDSLADSSVILKFFLKTRPLQQWPVKREMLRRIKRRFDELGIEIPFPHQTVYYHPGPGMPREALPLPAASQRAA